MIIIICKDTERGRSGLNDSTDAPFYSAKFSTYNHFFPVYDIDAPRHFTIRRFSIYNFSSAEVVAFASLRFVVYDSLQSGGIGFNTFLYPRDEIAGGAAMTAMRKGFIGKK